ncbi:hypothetical protein LCGC14_2098680 [marine sediment metagenome]|uniref:Uncharacterized protein n=1 Tax=marine sediment metagenome TaxID=412755 RepID=A0A0F9H703_9ZZZZ
MSCEIRLSEKHGVNPTLGICFWCGGADGSIALLGRLPGDEEAAHRTFISYDPCDDCKAQFEQGITLVECSEHPNDPDDLQPPIQKDRQATLYPTGRYLVITEEAIERLLPEGPMLDAVLSKRRGYLEVAAFEMINPTETGEEALASEPADETEGS